MASSTALTDPAARLVADASTVINLIATGSALDVLAALPNRVTVVDVVPAELETGRARGRAACDELKTLVAAGRIDIVPLPDEAGPHFEGLVVGAAVDTLDDGEAATIVHALATSATALIDERKATRICAARFPRLRLASTVDLLAHPEVQRQLGAEAVGDLVFRALRDGRMSVLPHQLDGIVNVIGEERAALCASLPRRLRTAPKPPSRWDAST